MTVIVGELGVFQRRIKFRDVFQKFRIAPLAAHRRTFRIAIKNAPPFDVSRIALLFRPHRRRVRFVIPHRHAVIAVHKNIRLVHVTDHALRRRNRPREFVLKRMPGFVFRYGRVSADATTVVTVLRIRPGTRRVTVIRINDVTTGTTRRAVIAGLFVGPQKPHQRIVQPRLGDIDQRHGDPPTGAGAAVGLFDIGPPRLIEQLQAATTVRNADLGKLAGDHTAAALEHPVDIGRRHRLPGRQRIELRQHAVAYHPVVGRHRVGQHRGATAAGIGFAKHATLERQYAIVVSRAIEQHRSGGHDAALGGLDHLQVTGTAGLTHHPVIGGIDEAHKRRFLAIEQRVGNFWISRGRRLPLKRIARQHVGAAHGIQIGLVIATVVLRSGRTHHRGIATVTIRAAEYHRRVRMHGVAVGCGVTRHATAGLGLCRNGRLLRGRRRRPGCLGVCISRRRIGETHQRSSKQNQDSGECSHQHVRMSAVC